jgi:hypothetical protein
LEHHNIYRISRLTIGAFLIGGLLFLLIYIIALINAPWQGLGAFFMLTLVIMLLSTMCIGWSVHLWRKRKEGMGFYWDEEGIVVDLKGNKIYWNEIESIQFYENKTANLSKATVIYPHYTHHEKIRVRLKKWMPTPAHSIDWFLIEKPREYHEQLMKVWEEKAKFPD